MPNTAPARAPCNWSNSLTLPRSTFSSRLLLHFFREGCFCEWQHCASKQFRYTRLRVSVSLFCIALISLEYATSDIRLKGLLSPPGNDIYGSNAMLGANSKTKFKNPNFVIFNQPTSTNTKPPTIHSNKNPLAFTHRKKEEQKIPILFTCIWCRGSNGFLLLVCASPASIKNWLNVLI